MHGFCFYQVSHEQQGISQQQNLHGLDDQHRSMAEEIQRLQDQNATARAELQRVTNRLSSGEEERTQNAQEFEEMKQRHAALESKIEGLGVRQLTQRNEELFLQKEKSVERMQLQDRQTKVLAQMLDTIEYLNVQVTLSPLFSSFVALLCHLCGCRPGVVPLLRLLPLFLTLLFCSSAFSFCSRCRSFAT